MKEEHIFLFDSFRLDLTDTSLRRGKRAIFLTPKAFTMLRYLVERAGQLVTKDDLWQAVWSGITVTDAALTVCMSEIRKALGDNAKTPQFIETVHRRGYRFIAPVAASAPPVPSFKFQVSSSKPKPTPNPQHPAPTLVGREAELTQLHNWLEKALNGERQIVFVTGEPGIGKTSVVEAFLQSLEFRVQRLASEQVQRPRPKGQSPVFDPIPNPQPPIPSLWIGRGQCIEHYGASEGYMPVLEALGRLCRGSEGDRFLAFLHQHAPTWLVQMPALLSTADLETLQRRVTGATRERMLREMAEAVEALTTERPLILSVEDLHWSDPSTLELLSALARRREAARLLVIGTYRPVEMLANGHPLRMVKQELQMHRQCEEQRLTFLTEEHVAEYLAKRFEGGVLRAVPLQELARTVHQRTEGNPLFMVNVIDHLVTQGVLVEKEGRWEPQAEIERVAAGVPTSIRQMIERQIDRLSPEEQRMLEVASVVGAEFSAAAVAAGAEVEVAEVEARCAGLARREQFLRANGVSEWPDGTVAARYGFLHALYQEALYERVTVGRRIELHRQIGEREERAYGERAREVAAELALHFERGRDYRKAVQYLQQAGENAVRRSANQEAVTLLTKGLELLKTLPDTPERARQELTLQLALNDAVFAVRGFTAPEVEKTVLRARELCQQIGEAPQLFPVLQRLFLFYINRGELQTTRELAEQLMRLAQSVQDR